MTKTQSWLITASALIAAGAFSFMCWKVSLVADTGRMAAWNVSALAWNSQPTVQHVNEATDVWAQASRKQTEAADELLRDLRAQSWHVDRTLTTFNAQMEHVGPLLDSLRDEAVELRKTTVAATGTLDEGKRTIQALQPVLGHSSDAVIHLDAILQDRNIPDTLANVQSVTQNTAGITLDLRKIADKTTEDYVRPKTPWQRIGRATMDLWDISAFLARHY